MKKKIIATLLLTTLLFAGCGQKESDTDMKPSTEQGTQATDSVVSNVDNSGDSAEITAGETFSKLNTTDLDGNTIDSSVFAKNKITLVNAWNVGCTPCVNEIPELDKINKDYADKGAAVLGLYNDLGAGLSEEIRGQIKDIMDNANADYTQLTLEGTLGSDPLIANMMVFPTTYVVDSEGNILETIQGSNDYDGWKAVIDSYLSKMD